MRVTGHHHVMRCGRGAFAARVLASSQPTSSSSASTSSNARRRRRVGNTTTTTTTSGNSKNGKGSSTSGSSNSVRVTAALVTEETQTETETETQTEETAVEYTDGRGDVSFTDGEIEDLGFTKVGKPVPYGIPMSEVLASIPKEAFEKDDAEAHKSLALTLVACTLSQVLIAVVPNWLLPVAWAIAGTAFTGFFVLAHDCGHRSFHTSKKVEDLVGNALMSPLIYPYEGWRFKHAQHHAKTNMLVEDTAWHPVVVEEMDEMSPFVRTATKVILGTPIKFFASILHWLKWHFDLSLYKKSEKPKVLTSILCCAAFAGVAFPLLVKYTGWFGFVKHWLMPWLGFHFWLSVFTLVHHTSPHIPFKSKEEWDPVQAQLGGTVHCKYPKWIEVLCFDINVHVPHHLSTRIPHYRLRMAYEGIKAKFGEYCNEAGFSFKLLRMLVKEPHVYKKETNYAPFKDFKGRY
uniref:Fatty acid desaturase domain-containing protein n=1 Tax=Chloropicon primus TaxID=1764295 RepID=A0A7S2T3D7_9CHLO|mmetsp:Transcript_5539/g.16827  ORF Transcript_5539/g.16827 Transcript_5539/m.16827 type:complete len:461 (+) Transcript_5539:156-1538(+)